MARIVSTLAALLLVVACTESTTETTIAAAPEPVGPGRLVVIDSRGDVVVMEPDGSDERPLTNDGGARAVYVQPVWSPDASRMAWGQATEDGFAVGLRDVDGEEGSVVPVSNLPFYMFWAPDGSSLGILHNGTNGVDFELLDIEQGTLRRIDSGLPFYFSWSPSGDEIVTHVGGEGFETIGVDGERSERGSTGPDYLAPQWTGAGVFHVDGGQLVLDGDEERRVVVDVPGPTSFIANAQATRVAVQTEGGGSGFSASLVEIATAPSRQVVIVDVATGDVVSVSDEPALGFFWSPDGDSLLILIADLAAHTLKTRVWDIETGITDYFEYIPIATIVQNMLPFFPQYAQSMSLWAADSSAFAVAGQSEGSTGIWVQSIAGGEPRLVADGSWVAWSPR
jgi:TolB protein